MAMVKQCLVGILVAGMAILASCSTYQSLSATQDIANAIELARDRVFSMPALDYTAKTFVRTKEPQVAFYRLADHFAQYRFTWKIGEKASVSVAGFGDVRKLERAEVFILNRE